LANIFKDASYVLVKGDSMKKVFLVVIGALLLSGCAASTQSKSEYSSADIAFAEMMIPHHEQAIEMSELALLNTTTPEVLQLAQEIKDAQSPEIELMKSWTGVKASTHAGHLMDGMLSQSEMSDLREAKDKDFDRLFLEGMIKHHEGAIEMAQDVATSENREVADLSASIVKAQELEIAKMNELLLKY
jgi:uncharacterized protein (DUF305 family)